MKTLKNKIHLLAIGLLLLLSSCVSGRKFAEAQNEIKRLKDQTTEYAANNAKLKQQVLDNESKNANLQHLNDILSQKFASLEQMSNQKINKTDMELQRDQKALMDLKNAVTLEENQVKSIKKELCDALKCFTPEEVSVQERNGELYVSMYDKLLFPSAGTIVNSRGKEALKILSGVLRNNNMNIMVEGHTDSVPIHNARFNDNWDLSVIRATNVIRVLTKNDNLDPTRIVASGKGKFQPFYSNKTAEGRRLNRRTDIVLLPKLEELYSLIDQNNTIQNNTINN